MADCPPTLELQIIAVHGGAGFHPKSTDPDVKRALRLACTNAGPSSSLEHDDEAALLMTCIAISTLEDDGCLNAGYGSNLTLSGTTECDASVMDGNTGDFGAVGSVSGVKNPIRLAHEVFRYSRKPDALGRIPPLLLVSSGALEFAKSTGLQCPPESLISPRAQNEWADWKSKLDAARSCAPSGSPPDSTRQPAPLIQTDGLHDRQDTVGAVAWDVQGHLAAGVSSGGLLLKLPGRIGEAATYGAGCWATPTTACSVSGAGEHITRMSLARMICEAIEVAGRDEDTHDVLQRVLGRDFLRLCSERGERTPQAGVLLLVKEVRLRDDSDSSSDSGMCSDREGGKESNNHEVVCNTNNGGGEPPTTFKPRLWCAFTTESMAVGYATSLCPKPSAAVLRRPPRDPGTGQGPSVYITALPLDC